MEELTVMLVKFDLYSYVWQSPVKLPELTAKA